jgi:predicted ribosome quality control (RQC) complex YloA/Tae2 family protein
MSKHSKQKETPESKPLIAGLVKVLFEVVKHFLNDFEVNRTAKKFEKYGDQFQTIENMLTKLDNKLQDYRREIEELKNRLLWSNILLIILLLILILQIVLN